MNSFVSFLKKLNQRPDQGIAATLQSANKAMSSNQGIQIWGQDRIQIWGQVNGSRSPSLPHSNPDQTDQIGDRSNGSQRIKLGTGQMAHKGFKSGDR
jgi:hypothetical protein